MYKLFLDDIRDPRMVYYYWTLPLYLTPDWTIVRNYDQFVNVINAKGMPELISFDHDLADVHYPKTAGDMNKPISYDNMTEKTGYHCAKWLIDYMIDNNITDLPEIYVHSQNPVGRENIKSLFDGFKKFMEK